jgi:hypothetical protein
LCQKDATHAPALTHVLSESIESDVRRAMLFVAVVAFVFFGLAEIGRIWG